MLLTRALVTFVLLPLGLVVIFAGGIPFALTIALIVGLAAWEYVKLFQSGGLKPAIWVVTLGATAMVLGRAYDGFQSAPLLISLFILIIMIYHLVAYERGRDQAAADFNSSLGGLFYLGWLGAYLISLRDLPEGLWWFLVALPAVWLADTSAYLIGSRFGKHQLCPRLSPKKTWEGFLAGVVFGTFGGWLFSSLCMMAAGSGTQITAMAGTLLGFILALLSPLGDLGESMIKRQVGAKDSSHMIPGHGGVFDRIDSWLWGGVIGYHIIVVFFL